MRADDVARFDAVGLADLVRRRAVSAAELLDAAIDAIDRTNPMLNAVVRTDVGRARAAIAAGLPDGRFTGVPGCATLWTDLLGWVTARP